MKDEHGLQSFVSTHSEESDMQFAFHPLFAIANAFNICVFENRIQLFLRGVGLGVESVHHCHQEVKS